LRIERINSFATVLNRGARLEKQVHRLDPAGHSQLVEAKRRSSRPSICS
jgi:hypothetical protein